MQATELRVAVRLRPLLGRDCDASEPSLRLTDATVQLGGQEFAFDRAFGGAASQQAVAGHCGAPLVERLFGGVHGCLFAFGQTGAGKTFSMLGAEGGRRRACQDGVLPLITTDIFRRVAQLEAEAEEAGAYQLRASFVEVYRERVYDLLVDDDRAPGGAAAGQRQQLRLRELDDGSVRTEGATEVPVRSTAQMLDCVARGSAARATAATGTHEHSSRSHAILTLTLEHRWQDPHAPPEARRILRQQAQLSLVDLAGSENMARSHGGAGDGDGISTNLGLHALTRVLSALASGAPHVPYRDATLTQLLKPALGGDCVTQMLACISPAAADAAETARTLRWAATARGLSSSATVHVTEEIDTDPMIGDIEDPSALQRRCLLLGPLPGCAGVLSSSVPVFARVAGDPSNPLVLYVHGSGPRNSSMFWNDVVAGVDALHPNLHHVAIDCPGYGRSDGDRQCVRSYPGALIEGIIRACGKRSAAALVGSSQGACSVLNALLERPHLAEAVAVVHPVGHAVERYTAISQPALLIFNTEDPGHPVEVGRRMRHHLPDPTYFEFAESQHGLWDQQNIAPELVKLIRKAQGKRRGGAGKNGRVELPELSVLAGGLRAWSESFGDEHGWERADDDAEQLGMTGLIPALGGDGMMAPVLLPSQVQLSREDVTGAGHAFFSDDESDEDEEAAAAAAEAAARDQAVAELAQCECELCGQELGNRAVRLVRCRHALCESCCEWSLPHFEQCPVCDSSVARSTRRKSKKSQAAGLPAPESDAARLSLQPPSAVSVNPPPRQVLVLQYGNTRCEKTAGGTGKTNYSTFVKVTDGDRAAIDRVSFNINPAYAKPTASLKACNCGGGVFSFDYAMARAYPCYITVDFKPQVGLPPLTIEYTVQEQRKFTRRLALQLPSQPASGGAGGGKRRVKSGGGMLLDGENCAASGWFLMAEGGMNEWRWRPAAAGCCT